MKYINGRGEYYIYRDILGGYYIMVLREPFGSWHYEQFKGRYNSEDEAIQAYEESKNNPYLTCTNFRNYEL